MIFVTSLSISASQGRLEEILCREWQGLVIADITTGTTTATSVNRRSRQGSKKVVLVRHRLKAGGCQVCFMWDKFGLACTGKDLFW